MVALGDMTLSELIARGDTRESLAAIRDHLAGRLQECARADAVAPIGKALVDVVLTLDKLPDPAEVSTLARIQDQLAARRASATGSPSTAV